MQIVRSDSSVEVDSPSYKEFKLRQEIVLTESFAVVPLDLRGFV